ncbi:MAG: hypothetical protein ABI838_03730 [Chloroflexota bacterium]
MPDDRNPNADLDVMGSGFEDFARSIHASYLDRWSRHDPAGLERQLDRTLEGSGEAPRPLTA